MLSNIQMGRIRKRAAEWASEEIDAIEDQLDDVDLLPDDFDPDDEDDLFETQRLMVKALIRELKRRYAIL